METKKVWPHCQSTRCPLLATWAVRGDRITDNLQDTQGEEFFCGRHFTSGIRNANWHSNQTVEVREL